MAMIALHALRPRERFTRAGYVCEVQRQARKTTFVTVLREPDPDPEWGPMEPCTVQLDRALLVERIADRTSFECDYPSCGCAHICRATGREVRR